MHTPSLTKQQLLCIYNIDSTISSNIVDNLLTNYYLDRNFLSIANACKRYGNVVCRVSKQSRQIKVNTLDRELKPSHAGMLFSLVKPTMQEYYANRTILAIGVSQKARFIWSNHCCWKHPTLYFLKEPYIMFLGITALRTRGDSIISPATFLSSLP